MAMTIKAVCDNKDDLVAYLYDEVTPAEREAIKTHLAACAACRQEIDDLRGVRGRLASWPPPEPDLGFRVVRDTRAPARWSGWRAPAWGLGLAAAATLVLAAAAAVANLEVRYDEQGLTVRTGWRAPAAEPAPVAAAAVPAPTPATAVTGEPWRADLQALEQRLRREIRTTPAQPVAAAAAVDQPAVLRQVSTLISESETRQERELALRVAQLVRDVDEQRRADWVRISQGFGRLENLTGAGVAQQREMMNYLMRVSQQR